MTTANPFSFCLGQFKLGLLSVGIERFPPNMLVILKKKSLALGVCGFRNVQPASLSGLGLPRICPALYHFQRIFTSIIAGDPHYNPGVK